MSAVARIVVLLGLIAGVAYLVAEAFKSKQKSGDPTVAGETAKIVASFNSSEDCRPCHTEIYDEWRGSWHARAYVDPAVRQQSNNYQISDCIPCHAPRPVFSTGIGFFERVLARPDRHHEGVDCLSCHLLDDGHIASANPDVDTSAPCAPVFSQDLGSVELCAPCHNQHETVDEWRLSPKKEEGVDCNACHMPLVERSAFDGGPVRPVRTHVFPGGHDPALVASSFSVDTTIEEGILAVKITNTFAAHNLPTDDRGRALDLVVHVYDSAGSFIPANPPLTKPGQTEGTFRARFRNPYRDELERNTQIPAGESASFEWELPVDGGRAEIKVVYKLEPYIEDAAERASLVFEKTIPF